jgi:hypothetical protein
MPRPVFLKAVIRKFSRQERSWSPPVDSRFHVNSTIGAILADPEVNSVQVGYQNGDFYCYERPLPVPVAGRGKPR